MNTLQLSSKRTWFVRSNRFHSRTTLKENSEPINVFIPICTRCLSQLHQTIHYFLFQSPFFTPEKLKKINHFQGEEEGRKLISIQKNLSEDPKHPLSCGTLDRSFGESCVSCYPFPFKKFLLQVFNECRRSVKFQNATDGRCMNEEKLPWDLRNFLRFCTPISI